MIITIQLEQMDLDILKEIVLSLSSREITNAQARSFWEQLPDALRSDAIKSSLENTSVRDNITYFLYDQMILNQSRS